MIQKRVEPRTVRYLDKLHGFMGSCRLSYPDTDSAIDWDLWRVELAQQLRSVLRLESLGGAPTPEPIVLESTGMPGYQRHKIAYETLRDNWVTAYLLLPDHDSLLGDTPAPERRPGVICPHGHVPGGKEAVVGEGHPFGAAYGHELASRGLVVLAPDNAGMGERDVPPSERVFNDVGGCMLAWVRINHLGLDLTGFRIFELIAGLNLLGAHRQVNPRKLGAVGFSGGSWLAQLLAALDPRIQAVVLSGFFTTFRQTLWHGHCICHHPLGLGLVGELPDIAALIAPRPMFIESGELDHNYPLQPAFDCIQRAYKLLVADSHLALHRHNGGHVFHGSESVPWLLAQLASD